MYLRQDYTTLIRPVLELKGFQRVTLKPGEEKTVSFPVGFEQIKFWKDEKWVAEPGAIHVHIGTASDSFSLNGDLTWQ
jgi:beta-glucosidase